MKKFFIIISVTLLAVGCSKNTAKNQQPPTVPTTTQNTLVHTYTNTKLKYAFQYPDGYDVRGFEGFGVMVPVTPISTQVMVIKTGGDNGSIFGVREDNSIIQLDKNAVEKGVGSPFPTFRQGDYSIDAVTIGGITGYKLSYHGSDQGVVSDFYYIQKPGGKVLDITVIKNNTNAQQMLNSFTFVDSNLSVNKSSDMATYTNIYGYQISYPSTWNGADGTKGAPYALSYYQIDPIKAPMGQPTEYIQISVLQKSIDSYLQGISKDIPIKDSHLNGQPAKEFSLNNIGSHGKTFVLENIGRVYVVSYYYDLGASVPEEELQKALDSFRLK